MRVIYPKQYPERSCDEDEVERQIRILRVLKLLDRTVSLPMTRAKLEAFMDETETSSVRCIQANRYEIFVHAPSKSTAAFDWLCCEVWEQLQQQLQQQPQQQPSSGVLTRNNDHFPNPSSIKQAILHFAVQQARQDDRIGALTSMPYSTKANSSRNSLSYSSSKMQYDKNKVLYCNFSLITSYGEVQEQQQHIDLQYPNFQYGLIITDQSPGTNVFLAAQSIQTVQHMKEYVWKDIPPAIYTAMKQNAFVLSILDRFGDVLCPNIQQIHELSYHGRSVHSPPAAGNVTPVQEDDAKQVLDHLPSHKLPAGTLLCLPGSEIHAGPACSAYRSVLFFSACPDVTTIVPYHPDTQYSAPLLCCDIIASIWSNVSVDNRVYMLHKFRDIIYASKIQNVEQHLSDPTMQQCARTIIRFRKDQSSSTCTTYCKRQGYQRLNKYFLKFAQTARLMSNEGNVVDGANDREATTATDAAVTCGSIQQKSRNNASIEAKKRAQKDSNTSYVGKRIAKPFEVDDDTGRTVTELFFGTVQVYRNKYSWWNVRYDDGDREDLCEKELNMYLQLYNANQSEDPKLNQSIIGKPNSTIC
jgi:hypothetical protein